LQMPSRLGQIIEQKEGQLITEWMTQLSQTLGPQKSQISDA